MDDSDEKNSVRHFGTDGWSTLGRSPIEEVLTNDEDWDAGMARLGWFEFSRIGRATPDITGTGSPIHALVLHRPSSLEEPQFLVELTGNTGDSFEHVFVQDLASLMTLLAAWAPVLQPTTLTNVAAALPTASNESVSLLRLTRWDG